MWKKVAIAVDDSDASKHAIEYVANNIIYPIPIKYKPMVVLVHCANYGVFNPVKALGGYYEKAVQHSYQVLENSRKQASEAGLSLCSTELVHGDPKDALLKFCVDCNVDAIVVATRKNKHLGSLTSKLVHMCPCPVVIIREPTDPNGQEEIEKVHQEAAASLLHEHLNQECSAHVRKQAQPQQRNDVAA